MVGVVSTDYAVRRNFQNQSATALLTINTRLIVSHIIKNAGLATGYRTDRGIRLSGDGQLPGPLPANTMCFRQDPIAAPTPTNYADDGWVCYTQLGNDLRTCAKAPGPPGGCIAGDALLGTITTVTPTYDIATNTFTVTVVNRDQPAVAKSISNPEVTWTSRTSPPGQSI